MQCLVTRRATLESRVLLFWTLRASRLSTTYGRRAFATNESLFTATAIRNTTRRYTTSNENPSKDSPLTSQSEKKNEMQHDSKEHYSPFYRRLALLLPNIPRPTRDDLLRVADGFWDRLRIRWKWFTVRGWRKFGADDFSAFFTWFLMSQTVWILVGTCV